MKSGIEKTEVICNSCGSIMSDIVTVGSEHEYDNTTDDQFAVVKCRGCGLCYLNPRPAVSELSTIYPENYYSYGQQKLKNKADPGSLLHRIRYAGFRKKIGQALSYCPAHAPQVVLDIGCGDGHLLNIFKDVDGCGVETHGVDFNCQAVKVAEAAGHKVYAGRFEDVELPEGKFDLVYASHVIEHVEDPKGFTQKVYKILNPGGVFWFETPNIASLDARIFRHKHWGGYHFPRHWFFFDSDSIESLARASGFEIKMIDYVPNAIFWYWTFHSMIVSISPRLRPLAEFLFPAIDFQRDTIANFLRICFFCSIDVLIKLATGQTSNMIVAFRKPS